jgi:undecaprenyl-diphosphatase
MNFFDAAILGILEGLTEFLPVSSTGHLILVSHILGLEQTDAHKAFEVSIQLGSILAVLWLYMGKLKQSPLILLKVSVGFIPTGILGFTLYKIIKGFFTPETVVFMLILGGIVLILLDRYFYKFTHSTSNLQDVTYKQAVVIGFAQSFAMIPGTSRSAATIIGGLFAGLDKKTAVEFSFLLAIPTMFAATFYDIYKNAAIMASADLSNIAVGFISAFLVALITVKSFTTIVSKIGFTPFGVYRILLSIAFWFLILQ